MKEMMTTITTIVFLLLFLVSPGDAQNTDDLLAAGQCEEFDGQPAGCRAVMVGAWSSVWTVPSYGLTQEYWVAQMEALDPDLQISSIDLVNIMPFDCAVQYLKLICPTYLRPCTVPGNSSLIDLPPAIPLSVCRSVCQVCFVLLFCCFSKLIVFCWLKGIQ